jgi:solute carrier family 25 phosphate transporter 3
MKHIVQQNGIGGLFKGIWMILLKQIPYTCCKLAGYDIIHQNILKIKERLLLKENGDNNNDVKVSDDYVTHLTSGAMAGVLAAIISHPADVLLSRVCGRNPNGAECLIIDGPIGLIEVMKDIGIKGLYTGLQPRAVMVGLMTSVQFLIYERMKVLVTHGQKKVDSYFYFDKSQNPEIK